MKTIIVIFFCALIAGVKLVPVPESETDPKEDENDEKYGGVPDHINGMPLERDGDLNQVSHAIDYIIFAIKFILVQIYDHNYHTINIRMR